MAATSTYHPYLHNTKGVCYSLSFFTYASYIITDALLAIIFYFATILTQLLHVFQLILLIKDFSRAGAQNGGLSSLRSSEQVRFSPPGGRESGKRVWKGVASCHQLAISVALFSNPSHQEEWEF